MYIIHAEAAGNKGFTVNAYCYGGKLSGIEAAAMVDTVEEAEAIAAKFAKGLKVRGGSIHNQSQTATNGWVSFRANLHANDVTGSKNETSIARIRKFFAACDKLGLTLKFDDLHCSNQIMSREEVEKQLNA